MDTESILDIKFPEEDKGRVSIPYFVHEGVVVRMERVNRRLWILCLVIFLALVITNGGWIWYESQFEEFAITQEGTADGGSDLTLNGVGQGDINYGSESTADD